jgi:endonuclease-3 related protein
VRTPANSPPAGDPRRVLPEIYRILFDAFGPQHWWPARTPTEVVIGAILTQNTAWRNVERAIAALDAAGALDFPRLHELSEAQLAELIRPAGTYRVKARRLKAFVAWLMESAGGDLHAALSGDLAEVRRRLLDVPGIGPETADAILLYAGGRPSFVVDAYTGRILFRHLLVPPDAGYAEIKALFEEALPPDAAVFNEYHALLVELAKRHCRARPDCDRCPLRPLPHVEPQPPSRRPR